MTSNLTLLRRLLRPLAGTALLILLTAAQAEPGLRAPDTSMPLQGWSMNHGLSLSHPGLHPSWQLLGDYHFARTPGLRLTGGMLGLEYRRPADPADLASSSLILPYMGLGWSAQWPQPGLQGLGWRVSADVGVLGLTPRSAIQLGQPNNDSRYAPLMQMGISYGF